LLDTQAQATPARSNSNAAFLIAIGIKSIFATKIQNNLECTNVRLKITIFAA